MDAELTGPLVSSRWNSTSPLVTGHYGLLVTFHGLGVYEKPAKVKKTAKALGFFTESDTATCFIAASSVSAILHLNLPYLLTIDNLEVARLTICRVPAQDVSFIVSGSLYVS